MSNYPNALDDDASLYVATDNIQSTLAAAVSIGDTSITVASATGFAANQIATIIDTVSATGRLTVYEHVLVTAVVGSTLTVTRGYAGTAARAHSSGKTVSVLVDAAYQSALKSAVIAIETALGVNMGNVAGVRADLFDFAAQTPGGSLIVGNNAITMTPVPAGVNGSNTNHYLYVSNGTGTAEACLITGGTGVAGDASGQIIINCANTHSGAWTIRSATAGIQEAIWSAGGGSARVIVPSGSYATYAPITVTSGNLEVVGDGKSSVLFPQHTTGKVFSFVAAGIGGAGYGNAVRDIYIYNAPTLTAFYLYGQVFFQMSGVRVAGINIGVQVDAGCSGVWLERSIIEGLTQTTGVGVHQLGGADLYINSMLISGFLGTQPLAGIYIAHSLGTKIFGCEVFATGTGLFLGPGNGQQILALDLTNNWFDSGELDSLTIYPTGSGIVKQVVSIGDWYVSSHRYGILVGGGGGTIDGVVFTAPRIYNNEEHGVFYAAGSNLNVVFTDAQVSGNGTSSAGTFHGFFVAAGGSGFHLQCGVFGQSGGWADTQAYGVLIDSGASDDYVISGANFTANMTGALADGGTGVNKIISGNLGVDDALPATIASGGTIALPDSGASVFYVSGNTAIATITGGYVGRVVTFLFTHASPAGVNAAGNVYVAASAAQNATISLRYDGTKWMVL